MLKRYLVTILCMLSFSVLATGPYAGQQHRSIKALSANEVSDLLTGKGMGLAKAGELNDYPGPKHVLELADKLGLSKKQLEKTQQLFLEMEEQAIPLGKKIVAQEKQLDQLFASKTVSQDNLKQTLRELGSLRAELRFVHLNAHILQKEIMSDKQVMQYKHLRGYMNGGGHHHGHHGGH